MRLRQGTTCLIALFLLPCAIAAAGSQAVHEYALDNGMKVLVQTDRRAPVVVSQVWYRVGAVDEHRGLTGISHLLEHMMFQGTDDYAPGEMSDIIARHGGSENAFTSYDYTAYYQKIASEHLGLMLRLEADRMTDLRLQSEQFEPERRVVQEERSQRVDDQPRSLTWERLRAAAFPASARRQPIIGWGADIESLSLEQTQSWYERWYAPDNATLVVVGDVDPERVRKLAQRHFGDKQPAGQTGGLPDPAISPRGETRLKVHAPAKLPYLAMGWRVPSLATADDAADIYALDVLNGILDGGRSSRIQRRIVREQGLAASAGASFSMVARTDTLFRVSATPAQGTEIAQLEQALRAEVERLKSGDIERAELERVKTNVRASDIFQRDSMFYQAMRIGMLETVGLGHEAHQAYLEGVERVTAEDVRRVARRYLTDRRLTLARLVPEGVEASPGTTDAAAQDNGGQHGEAE